MRAPAMLDDNNVRTLKKTVIAKRNTRATAAAAKKKETLQKVKKSVPQLGEQAKQSLAPLKVFSDDIVDENGMVRGTNIEDYLPDDVQFESAVEEVGKFQYGHSLVNPGTPLTTMMRRLHTWYLDCCKSAGGQDSIWIQVKENQDDLVAIGLMPVPFEELFHLYNGMPSIK